MTTTPSCHGDETLVSGGRVLVGFDGDDRAQWLDDAAVLVRNGLVAEVGSTADLSARQPGARRAGGSRFTLIPGLVNAHHHVGLTPFQLGSPDHPLELWFASRLALRDVDPELDTLYSAMEMVRSGVTTVQHLTSRAPGTVHDVLDVAGHVISAYQRIGLRVSYSMALRDQNRIVYGDDEKFAAGVPAAVQRPLLEHLARFAMPLPEQVDLYRELRRRHHDTGAVAVQLAPANLHWLTDDALSVAADLSAEGGTPLHMHVVETPYQRAYARRRGGGTAVEYLDRFGLLSDRLTIGHGTWLSDSDIELCADRSVHVCHNCSSNMRLASGRAPVARMVAAGIPVALGIDEAGINDDRDMLQEIRLAFLANRTPGIDSPRLSAGTVLRMATEHGAGTTPFAGSTGRLAPGRAADLVLLDWETVTYPYQSPRTRPEDVLVQRARSGAVHSVMVDGIWVLEDRRFTRVDRSAVLAEVAERLAREETDAERARPRLADAVMLEVRRFYDGYLDTSDDPLE